jgi:hypothetical protein
MAFIAALEALRHPKSEFAAEHGDYVVGGDYAG